MITKIAKYGLVDFPNSKGGIAFFVALGVAMVLSLISNLFNINLSSEQATELLIELTQFAK